MISNKDTAVDQEILKLVRRHFPQVAERELQEAIATVGQLHQVSAGKVLMEAGSYVKFVPLVVEGNIRVIREDDDGNELFLYYLGPGEACSASFTCCMMHKKSSLRTETEEDTLFIAIPVRYMDEWMTTYQSWKNFVMTTYDERMLEMVRSIDSIAFHKMDERLLEYLEGKSKATGSKVLTATHQQIAQDLNASREAISRLLKQMEKEHIVALGRNKIELL